MRCNLCKEICSNYYIDGKTKIGPWAYMCLSCFKKYGVGLGIGKGQKYDTITGKKVEG